MVSDNHNLKMSFLIV